MIDYKRFVVALGLVCLLGWASSERVQAAAVYDWCVNSCDSEASCTMECEADGGGTTTCGDYEGGPANDWCDGDTCEFFCSVGTSPAIECYDQDVLTDCYGYGLYASCGDDYCAFQEGLENCDTCEDDCGECKIIWCGNNECEDGESYRTCPEDCPNDGMGHGCGDGICAPDDTDTCSDCQDPEEFCDGINHFCPVGNQCVANYCSLDDVSARQTCNPNQINPNFDCPVGYLCLQATDVMTNQPIHACFLDRH